MSVQAATQSAALRLEHAGVCLTLLPQRAVLIEHERALLVSDLHLGKAATFRKLGVPVPEGTTLATLARLDALLEQHQPAVLCVLGDLLHAPAAHTPLVIDALANWRARHQALRVLLVRGNHDDRAGDPPPRCDIQVVDEPYAFAGLALRHMPPRQQAGLRGPTHALAGHLHPVVSIASRHDRVRLPCFLVQDDCLVLPAFGDFTGGWPVDPAGAATVFPTDGERVYQLPRTSDATMRRR